MLLQNGAQTSGKVGVNWGWVIREGIRATLEGNSSAVVMNSATEHDGGCTVLVLSNLLLIP